MGILSTLHMGKTRRIPSSMDTAACLAVRLPLKESVAITIFMVTTPLGQNIVVSFINIQAPNHQPGWIKPIWPGSYPFALS